MSTISAAPALEAKPAEAVEALSDDYLALIRRRPLRPIRDEDDYDAAVEIMYEIDTRRELDQPVSQDEIDYSDTTMLLVADWDAKHDDWMGDDLPLTKRLEGLMENAKVDAARLAEIGGIGQAEISEVLAGRRDLPREAIKPLAAHFRLSVDYFF